MSESKCKSCGKPFGEHAGLQQTCALYREAKAALWRVRAENRLLQEGAEKQHTWIDRVLAQLEKAEK